jgi:hypothetical protein
MCVDLFRFRVTPDPYQGNATKIKLNMKIIKDNQSPDDESTAIPHQLQISSIQYAVPSFANHGT